MKILADENIPFMTIEAFRASGHDVVSLHDASRKGIKDSPVWPLVQIERRMLVTTDKGFAKQRTFRFPEPNVSKICPSFL